MEKQRKRKRKTFYQEKSRRKQNCWTEIEITNFPIQKSYTYFLKEFQKFLLPQNWIQFCFSEANLKIPRDLINLIERYLNETPWDNLFHENFIEKPNFENTTNIDSKNRVSCYLEIYQHVWPSQERNSERKTLFCFCNDNKCTCVKYFQESYEIEFETSQLFCDRFDRIMEYLPQTYEVDLPSDLRAFALNCICKDHPWPQHIAYSEYSPFYVLTKDYTSFFFSSNHTALILYLDGFKENMWIATWKPSDKATQIYYLPATFIPQQRGKNQTMNKNEKFREHYEICGWIRNWELEHKVEWKDVKWDVTSQYGIPKYKGTAREWFCESPVHPLKKYMFPNESTIFSLLSKSKILV